MSLLEESRPVDERPARSPAGPEPTGTALTGLPAGSRRLSGDMRTLLRLAIPVVLAEIGWMSMGIVDTLMVGSLGPEAIGAVGLGSGLFSAVGFFGMGMLLGLDTLVSQAFGARRMDECHRWLFHGAVLALLLTVPLGLLAYAGASVLDRVGLNPDVAPAASSYILIVNGSLPPLLLYATCRRYLQAIGVVGPITFALVSANVVNAIVNWVLIYGTFGFPALGTDGTAWATALSRVYMAAVVIVAVIVHDRRVRRALDPRAQAASAAAPGLWQAVGHIEAARLGRLAALGGPAATQLLLEVGVFAAATALAGTLTPVALAAHQISLNIISLTFMVPLGVASAGAVLVGQAVGRRDPHGAARAGWLALALSAGFMAIVGVIILVLGQALVGLFTTDRVVIGLGATLLAVAAIFQLFDGLQVVATGILRGAGDTRTPMLLNLAGHWAIGLPIGWWCCFVAGWGVVGLWVGLSLGLILVGIVLVGVWSRATHRLAAVL